MHINLSNQAQWYIKKIHCNPAGLFQECKGYLTFKKTVSVESQVWRIIIATQLQISPHNLSKPKNKTNEKTGGVNKTTYDPHLEHY